MSNRCPLFFFGSAERAVVRRPVSWAGLRSNDDGLQLTVFLATFVLPPRNATDPTRGEETETLLSRKRALCDGLDSRFRGNDEIGRFSDSLENPLLGVLKL